MRKVGIKSGLSDEQREGLEQDENDSSNSKMKKRRRAVNRFNSKLVTVNPLSNLDSPTSNDHALFPSHKVGLHLAPVLAQAAAIDAQFEQDCKENGPARLSMIT